MAQASGNMTGKIDWEREWNAVRAGSMLSKCRVGDKGFSGYFDNTAEEYLSQVKAHEDFYHSIVDHLADGGFLREGDDVLDIACGPGTYTLSMAEKAKTVAALDPAGGMLAVVMRESAASGLSNVRSIKSTWEDYDDKENFDLVFTALSPGIKGPAELMKMERFSRRSCCYITFGESGSNNKLGDELWELVMGEKKKNNDFNVTYPFNLLHSRGRKPNVRFFEQPATVREPVEEVIKSNVEWLGMFTQMDGAKVEKVRDHVNARSTDGYYERDAKISLVALYWDVPQ